MFYEAKKGRVLVLRHNLQASKRELTSSVTYQKVLNFFNHNVTQRVNFLSTSTVYKKLKTCTFEF
nr:MAG TPA: hypothetical protein [Caudoviricetes sp.]